MKRKPEREQGVGFEQKRGDMVSPFSNKWKLKRDRNRSYIVSPFSNKWKLKRDRGARFEQNRSYIVSAFPNKWKPKCKRGARFEQHEGDMVKWRRKAPSEQNFKHSSKDLIVDRISMLPDDLLGLILSHLTIKDQMASSILSRRWRYLWTLTKRLDLDCTDSLMRFGLGKRDGISPLDVVKSKYVSWVNHVLAYRKGSAVEDFKLCFDLGKKDEGCIDEWLRYALAWKVKKLEINLDLTGEKRDDQHYAFPHSLLRIDDEIGSSPVHFKQLKKISLDHVDVDGKALEFFLHNCLLLEELSVSYSALLSALKIIGPLPSLKRLEISSCHKLSSLEICGVNLVYLKYDGRPIDIILRKLPMLTHISVAKPTLEHMKANVAQFSSILEQLEILNLELDGFETYCLPVEMSNLKQLEVVVPYFLRRDESLLWLSDLIHSAPHVQKFVLQSRRLDPKFPRRELQRMKMEKTYPHLKEVEFVGFFGTPSDLEFVFHIVDNAVALEKIRIDTKKIARWPHSRKLFDIHFSIYKNARNRVEKQLALEKPWIKLEFLITKN